MPKPFPWLTSRFQNRSRRRSFRRSTVTPNQWRRNRPTCQFKGVLTSLGKLIGHAEARLRLEGFVSLIELRVHNYRGRTEDNKWENIKWFPHTLPIHPQGDKSVSGEISEHCCTQDISFLSLQHSTCITPPPWTASTVHGSIECLLSLYLMDCSPLFENQADGEKMCNTNAKTFPFQMFIIKNIKMVLFEEVRESRGAKSSVFWFNISARMQWREVACVLISA